MLVSTATAAWICAHCCKEGGVWFYDVLSPLELGREASQRPHTEALDDACAPERALADMHGVSVRAPPPQWSRMMTDKYG